ncbi:RNI-like protein [Hysterangium stoloniferum]|nr:RNI-like protein [Hysterangium stoloniferum]
MSKRSGIESSGSSNKRAKKSDTFGAPSADDQNPLTSQLTAPSSTSLSTRTLPIRTVPALVTLCARVFVANLDILFEKHRDDTQYWLKLLPDAIVPRLFAMLSTSHPSKISHPFISTYFLRGDPITLSGNLPGVSSLTLQALGKMEYPLQSLQLTDLDKISDNTFARIFPNFPTLETVILRGCERAGKATVDALAKGCKKLKILNLSYTSAPPKSISLVTGQCLDLEVLKLAGIRGLTDIAFATILNPESDEDAPSKPLERLRSLKLRHTLITELSLSRIASRCVALTRLDVSFTPIRQPTVVFDGSFPLKLEKLSLTATPLTSAFLQKSTIELPTAFFSSLRVLQFGALGSMPSSRVRTTPGSLTLTDQVLDGLIDVLAACQAIESISLVGNAKLGLRSRANSALARFIRTVGRRCKVLNLAGITHLRSSDLAGLAPMEDQVEDVGLSDDPASYTPSPLHTLNLNNTDVGDEAAQYIASCKQLSTFELAGTKFGYDSLFSILDGCEHLTTLDLTSCRGIKVGDRRRFFEIWKEHQNGVHG